jgi:hypothetical protein
MNHSNYLHTRRFIKGQPWFVDTRHINILHELALALPQNAHICEVGSFCGASTSAFIEALHKRPDLTLTIHETKVLPDLLQTVDTYGPTVKDRVAINQFPLYGRCPKSYDLVFIDGDHGWPALADLSWCLTADCGVLALHDTHGTGPKSRKVAHGSILAANFLRHCSSRGFWEDYAKRKNEWTDRGFVVSWRTEKDSWVCSVLH